MPLPLLLAFAVVQGQTNPPAGQVVLKPIPQAAVKPAATPAQAAPAPPPVAKPLQAAAAQSFTTPFPIAEQYRIALTPKIDGRLDDEEWDPLAKTADMQSFFQWEPGRLYIAAVVPDGHDVLASFDLHANGWLHGKDNLEVRLSNNQGKVSIVARIMDGTGIDGPKWIDLPGFSQSSYAAAADDGKATTFEACIRDTGLDIIPMVRGSKMLMRIDDPLTTDPQAPAYLPRTLSPVTLVMWRDEALPPKLVFNPELVGRSSLAGEGTRLRLAFNGTEAMKLKSIEMHTEGPSKGDTIQMTVPFPKFDDKGRAYVDYNTGVMEGSPEGYRVLKATLMTSDNVGGVMECSYRIGPYLDFDIVKPNVAAATTDRSLKFSFYANSNSAKSVSGDVVVEVPDPLKIVNGALRSIGISTNRGNYRDEFELFIPANTSGTFPIKFVATVKGKKFEQTQYITIGGL